MSAKFITVNELIHWLARMPIIAHIHPLLPLCLPIGVEVVDNPEALICELDSMDAHNVRPLLMLRSDRDLQYRLPLFESLDHPPVDLINKHMAYHLSYARKYLLTNHKIASYLEQDVIHHPNDIIVLFLVDGLSYSDVLDWPCELQPCFIDGPSITFNIQNDELVEKVGFPAIINRPSIYQRLYQLGYRNARGYTYWERSNNPVASYMYDSLPLEAVSNFERVLQRLDLENLHQRSYIQIVREGLDGLAHGKRELRHSEIKATTDAIVNDIQRLLLLLKQKGRRVSLYLTADHGVLWKNEHEFRLLPNIKDTKPRFSLSIPANEVTSHVAKLENGSIAYYLYHYPYLGSSIRTNDSGIHGGLSYQESIVPFCKFKV